MGIGVGGLIWMNKNSIKFKRIIQKGILEERKHTAEMTRADLSKILKANGFALSNVQIIEAFLEFKGK